MKKRKRKLTEFARDFLRDGIIEPTEKIELEQWLCELDPPPSLADIMVLKRALVDIVATDLEKNRLKIPAHQAVRGVDRMVEILLTHQRCVPVSQPKEQPVEVHFSNRWDVVEEEMNRAEQNVDIAVFALTYDPLRKLLYTMANEKNITIRILTEDSSLLKPGDDIPTLAKYNNITVKTDGPGSLMHHKFIIIDGKIVLNGSMNFTFAGVHRNDENIMVARHLQTAELFQAEFDGLWSSGLPLS